MNRIFINIFGSYRKNKFEINYLKFKKVIRYILFDLKLNSINNQSIIFNFIDNKIMTKINRDYLNYNCTTDVIIFDYRAEEIKDDISAECFVNYQLAIKEIIDKKDIYLSKEIILYALHSILHLFGFNDIDKKDSLIMKQKEFELMKNLNLEFNFSEYSILKNNINGMI